MLTRTTPAAIGFPLPDVHAPDFGVYDETTGRVLCLRCRQMIDAARWAKPCVRA